MNGESSSGPGPARIAPSTSKWRIAPRVRARSSNRRSRSRSREIAAISSSRSRACSSVPVKTSSPSGACTEATINQIDSEIHAGRAEALVLAPARAAALQLGEDLPGQREPAELLEVVGL